MCTSLILTHSSFSLSHFSLSHVSLSHVSLSHSLSHTLTDACGSRVLLAQSMSTFVPFGLKCRDLFNFGVNAYTNTFVAIEQSLCTREDLYVLMHVRLHALGTLYICTLYICTWNPLHTPRQQMPVLFCGMELICVWCGPPPHRLCIVMLEVDGPYGSMWSRLAVVCGCKMCRPYVLCICIPHTLDHVLFVCIYRFLRNSFTACVPWMLVILHKHCLTMLMVFVFRECLYAASVCVCVLHKVVALW